MPFSCGREPRATQGESSTLLFVFLFVCIFTRCRSVPGAIQRAWAPRQPAPSRSASPTTTPHWYVPAFVSRLLTTLCGLPTIAAVSRGRSLRVGRCLPAQAKTRCCADTVAATRAPSLAPTAAPTLCPVPEDFLGCNEWARRVGFTAREFVNVLNGAVVAKSNLLDLFAHPLWVTGQEWTIRLFATSNCSHALNFGFAYSGGQLVFSVPGEADSQVGARANCQLPPRLFAAAFFAC